MGILVRNKEFYRKVLSIALPLAGQQVITAGVNMMDTIMLGQVSEIALAAANLGTQVHIMFTYISLGTGTGVSTMVARYWGAKDMNSLKKASTLAFRFIVLIGILYTLLVGFFPHGVLRILTNDEVIITEGVKYLNWSVPCYLLLGITTVATCIIRNVGHVRLPLYSSIGAFFINIFFNWVFIFGKLGAPAMGIAGAALGTLISRIFEFAVICGYMFFKDQNLAYRIRDLFGKCSDLLQEFVKITVPSIVSDVLLGLGASLTTAVGGRISQAFMSGNSITAVVQQGIIIFTSAMGQSSQMIIGNTLGEGKRKETQTQACTFMIIAFGLGLVAGALIFVFAPAILAGYNLSAGTYEVSLQLLKAQALMAVIMIPSSVGGKGILRGGGDTRYLMMADVLFLWVVSVPLGYLAGVVWGWSAFIVFIFLKLDHLIKLILFLLRIRSGKWVKKIRGADGREAGGVTP
ncbi:MAG: MATE family efflux transporter [Parasporobacterium sp.]|nr:MATE family efflux transporter [Parasporobacterium sp.]